MGKVHEKQLQKRKQETLDMALRLLMERGYANLNMDELAEEMGISKPTLYQYFNSKDELVAQVMVRMLEKTEEQLSALADKSPLDQLQHFLRFLLKSRAESQTFMAHVDVEIMRSFMQRNPAMLDHIKALRNKLSQIVMNAQDQGEIDPGVPTWVVVNLMFSLQGVINNRFMKDDLQRTDEEITDAIESIVRLFSRGVSVEIPSKLAILP